VNAASASPSGRSSSPSASILSPSLEAAAESARKAELARLAAAAAAEEATRLYEEEAAKRQREAEVARLAAEAAAEEVARARRMKTRGHAQWARTRHNVVTGARMAHSAKVALAVKCAQDAEMARLAALAAAKKEENFKAAEQARREQMKEVADVKLAEAAAAREYQAKVLAEQALAAEARITKTTPETQSESLGAFSTGVEVAAGGNKPVVNISAMRGNVPQIGVSVSIQPQQAGSLDVTMKQATTAEITFSRDTDEWCGLHWPSASVGLAEMQASGNVLVYTPPEDFVGTAVVNLKVRDEAEPKELQVLVEADPNWVPSATFRRANMNVNISTTPQSPSPQAEIKVLEDGTKIMTQDDGTLVQYNVDGTVITTYLDGTMVQKNPDGLEITIHVDGTQVQQMPDGMEITIFVDGTQIQKNPNGFEITTLPTGVQIVTQPDGTKIQTDPATGVQIVIQVDGTMAQTNPDGIQIVTRLDGTTFQRNPDGETITTCLDGSVLGVRTDGCKYTIRPDGTQSQVEDTSPKKMSGMVSTTSTTSTSQDLQRQSVMMYEGNEELIQIIDGSVCSDGDPGFEIDTVEVTDGRVVKVTGDSHALRYTPAPGFSGSAIIKYMTVKTDGERVTKEIDVHVSKQIPRAKGDSFLAYQLDTGSDSDSESGDYDSSDEDDDSSIGLWRVSC